MGRLQPEFLERIERFGDRVLDVAEELTRKRVYRRLVDQIAACGTSVGANVFEATEAMSRPDFCCVLGISLKELSEARYWLRLIGRRGWIGASRLEPLEAEAVELVRIIGAMISNTREVDNDRAD